MYKNILLALLISLMCLSLTELYFRINGKYATYVEKTGAGGYVSPFDAGLYQSAYNLAPPHAIKKYNRNEFTVAWMANNEGLNDSDFVLAKKKIRIMAFGDSYTEGTGADNDSSFPRQLGYLLKDSLSQQTEVWNCGVSGADPVSEFRLFRDKLVRYKPDMVLVVVNASDVIDVMYRGGFERFLPDGTMRYRRGPWFEPFYARSFLVRRLVHDVFKYNWQFISPGEEVKAHANAIATLTNAIDSFAAVCSQRNIDLLIVSQPFSGQFDTTAMYENGQLISYCKGKGIPCRDIRASMRDLGWNSSNVRELYWPIDGHCKNKGYHCFAEAVWKQVAQELDK